MSRKITFYEQLKDDEVIANLMALNGADPVAVYKKQTSTIHSAGIVAIPIGVFMLIVPPVGIGFIVFGVSVLAIRRKNIQKIKNMLAEQEKNASRNERESLKEEVRREMLKEELRAEIMAEKSVKKKK